MRGHAELPVGEIPEVLAKYAANKGQKIVFIHGKGDGVLRKAIEKELKTKYKQYYYQDASFREYGFRGDGNNQMVWQLEIEGISGKGISANRFPNPERIVQEYICSTTDGRYGYASGGENSSRSKGHRTRMG